jgi:hypothetical protein
VVGSHYASGGPSTTTTTEEPVTGDPLAGEDEPWAEEDFLRPPDEEDFAAFFRSLAVALVACLLAWLAIGGAVIQLYGLLNG